MHSFKMESMLEQIYLHEVNIQCTMNLPQKSVKYKNRKVLRTVVLICTISENGVNSDWKMEDGRRDAGRRDDCDFV